MTKTSLICIFLLAGSLSVNAQYIPVPSGSSISLNGTWKFNPSPDRNSFYTTKFQSGWKDIKVPGEWVMQGFEVKKGVRAAYQTRFSVPGEWNGKRVILRFDGVYSDAIVWINGNKAFSHVGGFNAFESDITSFLRKGPNLMTVGVMNESIADTLSCGTQYAAHPLGGIPRKVTLFSVPDLHISDLFVSTDLDDQYVNARLDISLSVRNTSGTTEKGAVNIDLIAPDGSTAASGTVNVEFAGAGTANSSVRMDVANPLKWNAEYPSLYRLRMKLTSSSGAETVEKRIGFRELEIAGNQLFLNGVPIKLHGVNRHEVHPLTGRSLNIELWRKDAQLYKEANVNYIRTSHYPPAEEFIDLCDSAGFYVELENPLVWIGHNANLSMKAGVAWDTKLRSELIRTTRETITFYRNHPGIIIWSLANESAWTDNWRAAHEAADSIDPTRPKSFHDQAYGIYNNYGSSSMQIANMHYPGPKGPEIADTFARPLLFGEYCHLNTYNRQEIATDPGVRDAWVEGFNRMWERMYKSGGCLGGALWSGIDDAFMLPEGRLVGYGEWGPVDGWRRLKPEYYHVKKTYSPVIIVNRKAAINEKGEINIQVENRFDFTDLKNCRFKWEIAGMEGTVAAAVPPHGSGIIRIGPFGKDINGKTLKISTFSPYGRLIDEAEIPIGNIDHADFPFVSPKGSKLSTFEDASLFLIKDGAVTWEFDKTGGRIRSALSGSDTIISGGAELMILPLHSEECKTEHSLNIPFINNTCGDWKPVSFSSSMNMDTAIISISGSYREAEVNFEYHFIPGGILTVKYSFTAKADINPRQVGLVFEVPLKEDRLEWYRKGFWSSYPSWHIGRTRGQAYPFPPEAFYLRKFGNVPEGEWRLDANSLGTNDFRSTKSDIYWASLTGSSGTGVAVVSDGKQAFRSWADGSKIRFLVAGYSNGGAEIFFASHLESERQPLGTGDKFEGEATLKIISVK